MPAAARRECGVEWVARAGRPVPGAETRGRPTRAARTGTPPPGRAPAPRSVTPRRGAARPESPPLRVRARRPARARSGAEARSAGGFEPGSGSKARLRVEALGSGRLGSKVGWGSTGGGSADAAAGSGSRGSGPAKRCSTGSGSSATACASSAPDVVPGQVMSSRTLWRSPLGPYPSSKRMGSASAGAAPRDIGKSLGLDGELGLAFGLGLRLVSDLGLGIGIGLGRVDATSGSGSGASVASYCGCGGRAPYASGAAGGLSKRYSAGSLAGGASQSVVSTSGEARSGTRCTRARRLPPTRARVPAAAPAWRSPGELEAVLLRLRGAVALAHERLFDRRSLELGAGPVAQRLCLPGVFGSGRGLQHRVGDRGKHAVVELVGDVVEQGLGAPVQAEPDQLCAGVGAFDGIERLELLQLVLHRDAARACPPAEPGPCFREHDSSLFPCSHPRWYRRDYPPRLSDFTQCGALRFRWGANG